MFVLPVMDLKQGLVVAGRAGQRATYQPLQSVLAADARPATVAAAYVQQLALQQVYVADLDAIGGAEPDGNSYARIAEQDLQLWIDAGTATPEQASALACWSQGALPVQVIVGLEVLSSRSSLRGILQVVEPRRTVVSLDLLDGRPWTRVDAWQGRAPQEVARDLLSLGVRRMILLDVARVGTGSGTGTLELLREVRALDAQLQLICGGGICSLEQIDELGQAGCDGVLLGSALHSGLIGAPELRRVEQT